MQVPRRESKQGDSTAEALITVCTWTGRFPGAGGRGLRAPAPAPPPLWGGRGSPGRGAETSRKRPPQDSVSGPRKAPSRSGAVRTAAIPAPLRTNQTHAVALIQITRLSSNLPPPSGRRSPRRRRAERRLWSPVPGWREGCGAPGPRPPSRWPRAHPPDALSPLH